MPPTLGALTRTYTHRPHVLVELVFFAPYRDLLEIPAEVVEVRR